MKKIVQIMFILRVVGEQSGLNNTDEHPPYHYNLESLISVLIALFNAKYYSSTEHRKNSSKTFLLK